MVFCVCVVRKVWNWFFFSRGENKLNDCKVCVYERLDIKFIIIFCIVWYYWEWGYYRVVVVNSFENLICLINKNE